MTENSMKTRVITAIVMVALMVPFFIWSDTVAFPILMAFFGGLGAYEMQSCIGSKKHLFSSVPAILVGAGLPFFVRYYDGFDLYGYLFLISFAAITYMLIVSVFSGDSFKVDTAALSGATTVYVAFGFASMVLLRDMPFGQYIYFLPFIISWMTDTFAYFTGMLLGKHKLIPAVSPKKTVEGAVGGTLFAVGFTVLYGFIVGEISGATPNYLALIIVSLLVSILSQCGDLIMSLIKRKFEIKDYGKLFPGHGGVLDRFDSIIVTAACIYFLTNFVSSFTLFN